ARLAVAARAELVVRAHRAVLRLRFGRGLFRVHVRDLATTGEAHRGLRVVGIVGGGVVVVGRAEVDHDHFDLGAQVHAPRGDEVAVAVERDLASVGLADLRGDLGCFGFQLGLDRGEVLASGAHSSLPFLRTESLRTVYGAIPGTGLPDATSSRHTGAEILRWKRSRRLCRRTYCSSAAQSVNWGTSSSLRSHTSPSAASIVVPCSSIRSSSCSTTASRSSLSVRISPLSLASRSSSSDKARISWPALGLPISASPP